MGLQTRHTDKPQFIREDYATAYTEACTRVDGPQTWYLGTGIAPDDHPLADDISLVMCDACKSLDVLVIAAQHNIHPFSGDAYWDAEIACNECGKFTQGSYHEL